MGFDEAGKCSGPYITQNLVLTNVSLLKMWRVAIAAVSVLGTSIDIAHEALILSVDLLELAPVPGLRAAALTLLNVWDFLQKVDVRIYFSSPFWYLPSKLTFVFVGLCGYR